MTANRPPAGSSVTVAVMIDDDDLAGQVRAKLVGARDIAVVGAGWPPAQVRISAVELDDGAPVLTVTASGGADAPPPRTAGIVTARISAAALCAAVRAIAQGLAVFSPGLSAVAVKDHDGPGVAGPGQEPAHVELTPRELEVLRLLAEGASNKAIARRLGITPHTAKFHVASIIGKLGASGRTDAVAKALRQGLLMI